MRVVRGERERFDANPGGCRCDGEPADVRSGTIKAWMGATHFLCRRLPRAGAEMSLARSGVQPEASDGDHKNRTLDRRATRLIPVRIVLSRRSPIGCRLGFSREFARAGATRVHS